MLPAKSSSGLCFFGHDQNLKACCETHLLGVRFADWHGRELQNRIKESGDAVAKFGGEELAVVI